jgi:hypothetical protein
VGTVKARLSRGRAMLATLLSDIDAGDGPPRRRSGPTPVEPQTQPQTQPQVQPREVRDAP